MHKLIDELVQYHRHKATVVADIQVLIPAVEKGNVNARDELGGIFASFSSDGEKAHHHNEELVLHELVKSKKPIHARIERTAEEHVVFGQLVQRLCSEISGPFDEPAVLVANIQWFLTQYDDHASNEEAILFPAADRELSTIAWSRVGKNWIDLT